MTAMNHEGETSPIWTKLKAKLKLLLSVPQVLSVAFDEGVRDNVEAEKRFFQEVEDRAEALAADRRSKHIPGQTEEAT